MAKVPITDVQLSTAILAFADALAGAGGGVISQAMFYPLQNVSTRMQVSKKQPTQSATTTAPQSPQDSAHPVGSQPSAEQLAAQQRYQGTLDAIRKILAQEGLNGLYAGLSIASFAQAVTQFVYYYCYSWMTTRAKQLLSRGKATTELSVGVSMLVGAAAGAVTAVSTNPAWTVNTRAINSPTYRKLGLWGSFQKIISEEGFGGLFSGVGAALVLVVNPTIQYMLFQKLKDAVARSRKSARFSPVDIFVLASIAKVVTTLITYPYILVKSRMQMKQDAQSADGTVQPRGIFAILKHIFENEGAGGFYKGLSSKIIQSVLVSAFMFTFQDRFKLWTVKLLKSLMKYQRAAI